MDRAPQRDPATRDVPSREQPREPQLRVEPISTPTSALLSDELVDERVDRATFLARLREMATTTAAEMLGARWSSEGCPYIDAWFARHATTDATTLERMAHRYSGRDGAASVDEMIDAIRLRLRMGIAYWRNGEDVEGELELSGMRAAANAVAADDAIGDAVAGDPMSAQRVVAELGEGERLSSSLTGHLDGSVPDVRVHTGPAAARLAARADAYAFTIGRDVVIGSDAPRPGSLVGDALLAHEVAHAQQQAGGASSGDSRAAEADANVAAARVVADRTDRRGLFGSLRRVAAAPLSLQRCPKSDKEKKIEAYEDRLKELDTTQKAKGSFGEVGAAAAEQVAVEHWLAVLKGGEGARTGTESGEATSKPVCNCTTYVVDILESTFTALGQSADWKKVKKKALGGGTGMDGLPLQRALVSELGWKSIFWAPDPTYKDYKKKKRDASNNVVTDAAGNEVYVEDSEHGYAYKKAKKGTYYKLPIDHLVVNYAPEKGGSKDAPTASTTVKDTSQLRKLEMVPFGVLTARGGLHMALIIYGKVYEVHWDKTSSQMNLYEATMLEDWWWDSGAIVAPAADVDKAFAP